MKCPLCHQEADLVDGWNRCEVCTEKAANARQEIYDQLVSIRERIEVLKMRDLICNDLSI